MSVQRYTNALGRMVPVERGSWVVHTDYAALEARCAGLERERDDLLAAMRSTDPIQAANCRVLEYHKCKAERDALQAKLAAAEEALIVISRLPYCDRHLSKDLARVALADTTTGEVQP